MTTKCRKCGTEIQRFDGEWRHLDLSAGSGHKPEPAADRVENPWARIADFLENMPVKRSPQTESDVLALAKADLALLAAKLRWTTALPTEGGYYWHQIHQPGSDPVSQVLYVTKTPLGTCMVFNGDVKGYCDFMVSLGHPPVLWAGPLAHPLPPLA